jgi:sulfur carrier protein
VIKVILRNQGKEVEIAGRRRVKELLAELGVLPDTVLVIRGRELLTIDEVVRDDDVVELRPVISGGAHAEGVEPKAEGVEQ